MSYLARPRRAATPYGKVTHGILIQDGADPIAAQAYAKEYYEQFEATRLRLFPEISNDELGDTECEAINSEVDKTLPNPFSVGAL